MNDLQRYLQNVANSRRLELLPTVYYHTQGRVQTGPFRGMIIVPHYMWGDGDIAAKLMGVYEDELHPYIESAFKINPDLVINVGSAEGYYAVGANLKTRADTYVVDLEQRALDITKTNAQANSAAIKQYMRSITPQELETHIATRQRPWLILDCEGYEETLLDLELCPSLAKAWILVETHDVFSPGLTDKLAKRFENTHEVTVIRQQTKDPYQFAWTESLSDCDKWALVHEGRPVTSNWLWMAPK